MKPTNKLRCVVRNGFDGPEKVLQQWWESEQTGISYPDRTELVASKGEWRDVPIETELEPSSKETL